MTTIDNKHAVTQATIDTILDNTAQPEVREPTGIPAGACQLGRRRQSLAKAWIVLNKWALERLVDKGAIEIPNFARVGWQRFRRRDGEVRVRPVFILSEAFCRAHNLPHKRILRPPSFIKSAEVVNYTKLAIRYTSSMTKDMIYGALREIFRGIGEAMSSGGHVCVTLSFGVLEANGKKFSFTFDPTTLCKGVGVAATASLDADSVDGVDDAGDPGKDWDEQWDEGLSTHRSKFMSDTSMRSGRSGSPRSDFFSADTSNGSNGRGNGNGNDKPESIPSDRVERSGVPHLKTARQNQNGRSSNGTPSEDVVTDDKLPRARWSEEQCNEQDRNKQEGRIQEGETEDEVTLQRAKEVAAEWGRKRGTGKKTNTQEKVWEYAFRDHVTALEGQAEDEKTMSIQRKEMQREQERRARENLENKQREMHDLLTFVQGQIQELEDRRARELKSKRTARDTLTFSARRDQYHKANHCFEGTAWRAPDWGPRRARARNVSREELLSSLQGQIREREQERALKNRRRLSEETELAEKWDREYDAREEHKRLIREEAMEDVKRSWERHVHLKKLRALAKAGPAAIREYALSQNILKDDGNTTSDPCNGDVGGRGGWIERGPRSITGPPKIFVKGLCRFHTHGQALQGQGSSSRRPSTSHSETSSVGFDSRRCARRAG